jgi:photosystem II stability/assembly factor-like uncharacterized protein
MRILTEKLLTSNTLKKSYGSIHNKKEKEMKKLIFVLIVIMIASMLLARPAVNTATLNEIRESREFDWEEQNSGFPDVSTGVNYMSAVDENVVWAVGYDGSGGTTPFQIVTHTTNGGTTWTATEIDTAPAGGDVAMIIALDENKAWCPIHTGSPQGIYYTDNGGANWTRQESADYNLTGSFPNVVHFFNENDGFAQGDPVGGYYELYTTSDGGANWTRVLEANIPAPLAGEWGIVGYYDAVGDNIWWGTQMGRVFYSDDKGLTWNVSQTTLSTYTDVTFKDVMNGIAQDKGASSTGTICETTDGGATWQAVTHTGNCFTNDMDYVPGTENTYVSTGAATGFSGASFSHDGGHNWIDFGETADLQFLATSWISSTVGWAGNFNDQTNPALSGMYAYTGSLIPQPMGTINGTITDMDEGFTIEGVTVTFGTFDTTTDSDGIYSMLVDVGIYDLACEIAGYESYTLNDVEIIENQVTAVDVEMQNLYLPPQNLSFNFSNPNVVLTWTAPAGEIGLTGYNVYRDDVVISNITATLYIDPNMETGTYTYYITALYGTYESIPSNEVVVEVVSAGNDLVAHGIELIGNYPNPFNPETQIAFAISEPGNATIEIFNIKGELVRTIMNGNLPAGNHTVTWAGLDNNRKAVTSGVYLYKMTSNNNSSGTKKMILMK